MGCRERRKTRDRTAVRGRQEGEIYRRTGGRASVFGAGQGRGGHAHRGFREGCFGGGCCGVDAGEEHF